MKRFNVLLLVISIFSGSALAANNMSNKTIKEIIVNLSTGIHFQINETMTNPDNCTLSSWYKIETDSKYEKEALSMLLAYEAQNKPITFSLDGCTGSYPKVVYIH